MPNHIKNLLTIIGTPEQVEAVKDYCAGEPYGDGIPRAMDFNKIEPMPEILEADYVTGSVEDAARKILGLKVRVDAPTFFDSPREQAELERILEAYKQTGFLSCLDWAREYWGTIWNAYGHPPMQPANVIIFETAWSGVFDLMATLVSQFPDLSFHYDYADENTGYNVGRYRYESRIWWQAQIADGSKQAYDVAFDLRPEYVDYYTLVDGKYINKEED